MEFTEQEVHLRTGVCPSCAREFAFVEGPTVATRLRSAPVEAETPTDEEEGEVEAAEVEVVTEGPECAECGTPLSFREGPNGALEVSCPECETTTLFVPKEPGHAREESRSQPRRFDADMPRGRPCRKCGAPLRFSTGDDGMLIGECDACGNRFTLPPRPGASRGGREFPQRRRYGAREFGGRPGGRPRYSGGGKNRPSRGYGRQDRRGRSDYDDEDRRPRRRRRREE